MRPIQEAFLELLRQGLDKSQACRRLSLGRSQPGYWASRWPEFEKAYRPYRGTLQKRCLQIDVAYELTQLLIAQGYAEESHQDEIESILTKFFVRIGAIKYHQVIKGSINRCTLSVSERRSLVDAYIDLKKSQAGTTHGLHSFLVEHRVSDKQISRWAKEFYGKGALSVGPYQPTVTRNKVLACVREHQECTPRAVADFTGINIHTVREYLRLLARRGDLKKVVRGQRVRYAAA